jgi:hypothetical protein
MFSSFFCSHKFHKIGNHFIFELEQKKLAPIDEISSIYNLKIVTKLSEMWFRIRKKLIPYPGPGSKMHRIPVRIRNTAFLCGRICFPDRVAGVVHLDWIEVWIRIRQFKIAQRFAQIRQEVGCSQKKFVI